MHPVLIGFLALLAFTALLVAIRAVTDVRIARHTGVDPRVDRDAAKAASTVRGGYRPTARAENLQAPSRNPSPSADQAKRRREEN